MHLYRHVHNYVCMYVWIDGWMDVFNPSKKSMYSCFNFLGIQLGERGFVGGASWGGGGQITLSTPLFLGGGETSEENGRCEVGSRCWSLLPLEERTTAFGHCQGYVRR